MTNANKNRVTQELREVMQFKNSCSSSGDRRVFLNDTNIIYWHQVNKYR
jgi:hypothetical protein